MSSVPNEQTKILVFTIAVSVPVELTPAIVTVLAVDTNGGYYTEIEDYSVIEVS